MFSVEADDINRLVKINWSENVSADEMRECAEQLRALTANMRPGFRLLSDLTGLKSMDPTGASYIGAIMDLFAAKQVSLIVRVIPPIPTKISDSIFCLTFTMAPKCKWRRTKTSAMPCKGSRIESSIIMGSSYSRL
jgi:hypothetical protein